VGFQRRDAEGGGAGGRDVAVGESGVGVGLEGQDSPQRRNGAKARRALCVNEDETVDVGNIFPLEWRARELR